MADFSIRRDIRANNVTANTFTGVLQTSVACSALITVATTIPNGTSGDLILDTTEYDTHGMHSTTVNPERITIPITGIYRVTARVTVSTGSTLYGVQIWKNNVGPMFQTSLFTDAIGAETGVQLVKSISLNAGDYITMKAFQNSGAPDTLIIATGRNYLQVEKV